MKLQKNLLWIPVVISFVWGIPGAFTPETIFKFLSVPLENVNVSHITTQMFLGISQICLGIIALWMRSIKDESTMTGAMTIVGLVFLIFGLDAFLVYLLVGALNTILMVQGVVFIIIAVLFFLNRKPK